MAGDWIKLRASISTNPKVLRIASIISESTVFGEKLKKTGDKKFVRDVTRDVTVASLVKLWSVTNEHTRDGVWYNVTPDELDDVAGVVGFCDAMIVVGWLEHDQKGDRCIFPNFLEYNAPLGSKARSKAAERQKAYRERQKQKSKSDQSNCDQNIGDNTQNSDVTRDVTRDVTLSPREEKKREAIKDKDFSKVEKPKEQKTPTKKKQTYSSEFDQFWSVAIEQYKIAGDSPGNKKQAYESWQATKPDDDLIFLMTKKIKEQAETRRQAKAQGAMIDPFKHVCRWISKECWDDVVVPRVNGSRLTFNNFRESETSKRSRKPM